MYTVTIIACIFVLLSFLSGCMANSGVKIHSPENMKKLPHTKFDIFNLTWGMNSNDVFTNCDWGGKLEKRLKKNHHLGDAILKFEHGKFYCDLVFNKDRLFSCNLTAYYPEKTQFAAAVQFYFYICSILSDKYEEIYRSSGCSNFLPVDLHYEAWRKGEITYLAEFESFSTKIFIALTPVTVTYLDDFNQIIVLSVRYSSKTINYIYDEEHVIESSKKRELDSRGL